MKFGIQFFMLNFNPYNYMKSVFPPEILDYSIELHRFRNLKKHKTIYTVLLLILICMSAAIPFLKIDLYKTFPGTIRPIKEQNLITSPLNGKIEKVFISPFSAVKKGDTLLKLDDGSVSQELFWVGEQLETTQSILDDLNYLCNSTAYSLDSMRSDLFRSQLTQYLRKFNGLERQLYADQRHLNRQKRLFKKGVIAKAEFETATDRLDQTQNELQYLRDQQKSLWQNELIQKRLEFDELSTKNLSLQENKSLHYIISPTDGDIQDIKSLEKNNFLYKGSSIAEISPQTDLVVECYISPSDVGLIKKEQEVKFRVDSFHHSNWSAASGRIVHIAKDIVNMNGHPVHKVLCALNEPDLVLNETKSVKLIKGMTLTVWFFIENRSLLQLLFDKMEDWYDPRLD